MQNTTTPPNKTNAKAPPKQTNKDNKKKANEQKANEWKFDSSKYTKMDEGAKKWLLLHHPPELPTFEYGKEQWCHPRFRFLLKSYEQLQVLYPDRQLLPSGDEKVRQGLLAPPPAILLLAEAKIENTWDFLLFWRNPEMWKKWGRLWKGDKRAPWKDVSTDSFNNVMTQINTYSNALWAQSGVTTMLGGFSNITGAVVSGTNGVIESVGEMKHTVAEFSSNASETAAAVGSTAAEWSNTAVEWFPFIAYSLLTIATVYVAGKLLSSANNIIQFVSHARMIGKPIEWGVRFAIWILKKDTAAQKEKIFEIQEKGHKQIADQAKLTGDDSEIVKSLRRQNQSQVDHLKEKYRELGEKEKTIKHLESQLQSAHQLLRQNNIPLPKDSGADDVE